MTEKDLLLKEETVLGLNEYVRLRREETGVILYWSARTTGINDKIDVSKFECIPSSTAMVLALFDGKRPLKEIFQAVKSIWEKPSLTFADFCKELEKFILLTVKPFQLEVPVLVEVTNDRKQKLMHYNPESFIIDGNKFCPVVTLSVLKFPTYLNVMPSMDCFTNCVYCYMGRHLLPKYSSLPFSRWEELFEEIEKYQLSELAFAGGDPMCYKHIVDMLEIVSDFDPPVVFNISTKAYISPEMAQHLSHIPKLDFQISLDSTDPEVVDTMMQKKGYGKQAIESIENCLSAGFPISVKSVVTPLNIKAMPQTILDLHNLGVYPIRTAIYSRSAWHHKDELFNKAGEYKEFEKRVKEMEAKYGFKIQMQGGAPEENDESQKQPKKPWNERSMCTIGKRQVVILPDGNLIGCEQIPQIPEYFLGNVAKDSLYDVWNSESFKQKAYGIPREKYKGTACYDCKEFKECHSASGKGYCMRESHRLFGTIYAPDPNCPYNDKKLPRMQ